MSTYNSPFTSNSPQPLLKGAPALVDPVTVGGVGFPTAVLTGTANAWKSGVLPIFGLSPAVEASGIVANPQNNPKQACWWDSVSAGLTSTQNVTITIQCYLDAAGLIPVGAAGTSSNTTTPYVTGSPGNGFPWVFLYFQVTITNTSGTTAIISNPAIAVGAT
jgi:hypothetical protein